MSHGTGHYHKPETTQGDQASNKEVDFPRYPHPFVDEDDWYGRGNPVEKYFWEGSLKSVIELKMLCVKGKIVEKGDWWEKMEDDGILGRWGEEGGVSWEGMLFLRDELRWERGVGGGRGFGRAGIDGVWYGDGVVEGDLRAKLLGEVGKLEMGEVDWHPGSGELVRDLVHPSLFCYVAGISRVVEEGTRLEEFGKVFGKGIVGEDEIKVEHTVDKIAPEYFSKRFQWLPSDVEVSRDGMVKFLSYINNLHPKKHERLYEVIAKVLERFIPIFENVLRDLVNPIRRPISYSMPSLDDLDYGDLEDDEEIENWYEANRKPNPPVFGKFQPPNACREKVSLLGQNLQVIIKIASIILTPENPKYNGGVWHVEGMANEGIVATGIYYFHSRNITESKLAFRQAVYEPETYEQNDTTGAKTIWGLESDGTLSQSLGDVNTNENRCLAFPNVYQHQVQPFELVNKSKGGERKILVFFLVDPKRNVISTSSVPPQQQDWFLQELKEELRLSKTCFSWLAEDTINRIVNLMDFPLSLEKATEYREQLMSERKYFTNENNDKLFEREFSLCEH